MPQSDLFPELPDYDPEPADGVCVGESPVPGLTLKRVLRGHTGWVGRIAWSPNGRFLASPSQDRTICIWDVTQSKRTFILKGHTDEVVDVAWSPDGQFLASASWDGTIHLWDAAKGKQLQILQGHTNQQMNGIAWSPDGQRLASAASSGTIHLWDPTKGKELQILEGHGRSSVFSIAWSPDGQRLASADLDTSILLWDTTDGKQLKNFQGHANSIHGVSWSPDGQRLASASRDGTIHLWSPNNDTALEVLEGHTEDDLICAVFSANGRWLASKGSETVCLWNCNTWDCVAVLQELEGDYPLGAPSCAFHPQILALATLCEKNTAIRIWELDENVLFKQLTTNSVRYTTAKIVLVGDSGVGKTGLGWRLANNNFKEHPSTHGQQFWIIDDLYKTRDDGTECEAVLWDLAGQPDYRLVHSLFLDGVDAALVLFDPTNRHEPLSGVDFWLNQLKNKGQDLCNSLLVGARTDRGTYTLTDKELQSYCDRNNIKGGYISTSARTGEGIPELLEQLQEQIPWDEMTATVTTQTFKRIKEYVLELKEQTDRQAVLVHPDELRIQLQESDPDWDFSDAEMMTAVGHLANHGYVTVLKGSQGNQSILLAPDLLANLASSIVLEARRNPRGLGVLEENRLLAGEYHFPELHALAQEECKTLLDAAAVLFLDHKGLAIK